MSIDVLYEEDFVRWTAEQAEALRRAARQASNLPLDWENLAEEIESLGKRDRREVESYVGLILEHLIKLAFSPSPDPRAGWIKEVRASRQRLGRVLRDSPSLRAQLADVIAAERTPAIQSAQESLAVFGEELPPIDQVEAQLREFAPEHILNEGWLPPPSFGSLHPVKPSP